MSRVEVGGLAGFPNIRAREFDLRFAVAPVSGPPQKCVFCLLACFPSLACSFSLLACFFCLLALPRRPGGAQTAVSLRFPTILVILGAPSTRNVFCLPACFFDYSPREGARETPKLSFYQGFSMILVILGAPNGPGCSFDYSLVSFDFSLVLF